jgi:hypothetical protein
MEKAQNLIKILRLHSMLHSVRLSEGGRNMNTKLLYAAGLLASSVSLLGCERTVSFAADIQPIFEKHCIECHDVNGEGVAASGFSVHDYDGVMKGTNFGPVVIPGNSPSSTLYMVITGKTDPAIHMPPHHAESRAEGRGSYLTQDEIDNIAAWIDQGARNN